uniref:Uncharacterized protein n=1 Tax=Marseillevirus LCMAC201 TaxID=2506605 RepID=A0A481YX70_9VIRU|nr:MAG: hypothetical protein LCMAC201_03870 [Marseillevirus LCMAC201]
MKGEKSEVESAGSKKKQKSRATYVGDWNEQQCFYCCTESHSLDRVETGASAATS